MSNIAQKHLDELPRIRENIEGAFDCFQSNSKRFNEFRNFIFKTSLTAEDRAKLEELKKPDIEFNVLEAYISRLRGEWSKISPSMSVRSLNENSDPLTIDVVESHLRSILYEADNDDFSNQVLNDILSGGFSVIEVWAEYESSDSFDSKLRVGRVYDPTMTGFDPLARTPHKGDAQYCYQLYPITKEKFKEDYPNIDISSVSYKGTGGFTWFYEDQSKDVLLVADYYEKKKKKYRIHQLSNGKIATDDEYKEVLDNWESFEVPPEVIRTRTTEKDIIVRYKMIGDQLIERPFETSFDYLPLVFVDGNSVVLRNEVGGASYQFTRPYIYHAKDAQRFKNYVGQSFAAEIENMEQHKWTFDIESIPPEYVEHWINPQIPGGLPYRSTRKDGTPLPSPQAVPRTPIPGEMYGSFKDSDSTIQNILGSYDASLGINDNHLSGAAIREGAMQSNSAAMPYLMNYITSLNQVARILLNMIPKYYVTPRTIPVVSKDNKKSYVKINQAYEQSGKARFINMMYPSNALEVRVSIGPNFNLQKDIALKQVSDLARAFPSFAQFINEKGLSYIVSNVDIKGSDELRDLASEFMREQDEIKARMSQGEQQNPAMIDLKLRQEQLDQSKNKLIADVMIDKEKLEIEREKMHDKRIETLLRHENAVNKDNTEIIKAQTEKEVNAHKSAIEAVKLAEDMRQKDRDRDLDLIKDEL